MHPQCPPASEMAEAATAEASHTRQTMERSKVSDDGPAQAAADVSDKPHQQQLDGIRPPRGRAAAPGAQEAALLTLDNGRDSASDQNLVNVDSCNSQSGQAANSGEASGVFANGQQQACPQEALDDDMGELGGLGGVLQQWVNPAIPPPAALPILDLKALGQAVPTAPISREDLQQVRALS